MAEEQPICNSCSESCLKIIKQYELRLTILENTMTQQIIPRIETSEAATSLQSAQISTLTAQISRLAAPITSQEVREIIALTTQYQTYAGYFMGSEYIIINGKAIRPASGEWEAVRENLPMLSQQLVSLFSRTDNTELKSLMINVLSNLVLIMNNFKNEISSGAISAACYMFPNVNAGSNAKQLCKQLESLAQSLEGSG